MDAGPSFPFEHALIFLQKTNTWALLLLSKQSRAGRNTTVAIENAGNITESDEVIDGVSQPDVANENSSALAGSSSNHSAGQEGQDSDMNRRIGAKRDIDSTSKLRALHRGAKGIEKLASASSERNKLPKALLELETEKVRLEKRKYNMSVFAMEGSDPQKRKKFLDMLQKEGLAEMESRDEAA